MKKEKEKETCPACNGTGLIPGGTQFIRCMVCGGTGKV